MTITEEKDLLNSRFPPGRYAVAICEMRAIELPTRVMAVNTDRKKALQTGALIRVRAMRSVLCDVLLARLAPLPSPHAGQPHRLEVLKGASNAFVAEEQALGDVGA